MNEYIKDKLKKNIKIMIYFRKIEKRKWLNILKKKKIYKI